MRGLPPGGGEEARVATQAGGWLSLVGWLGDVRGRASGRKVRVAAAPAALEGADHHGGQ